MGTLDTILGIVAALFAGVSIWQFINFRRYKAKYAAEAEKDTAEAEESKQSALERRLASLEALYESQGAVIDGLRKEILTITTEKYASDKRNVELTAQVNSLEEKVAQLESELAAYKVIAHGQA